MSSGRPLFVIDASGTVLEKYVVALPTPTELREQFFSGESIEHVSVLWLGRPAHAFVGANSARKGKPVNLKGSAIYQNYTRGRIGFAQYDTLEGDPGPFVLREYPLIYGRMLLWPARAPEWEPASS